MGSVERTALAKAGSSDSIPDAATDPRIDPAIRPFLAELNKDTSPFWELPQPRPQEILTALQNKTPVERVGNPRAGCRSPDW